MDGFRHKTSRGVEQQGLSAPELWAGVNVHFARESHAGWNGVFNRVRTGGNDLNLLAGI